MAVQRLWKIVEGYTAYHMYDPLEATSICVSSIWFQIYLEKFVYRIFVTYMCTWVYLCIFQDFKNDLHCKELLTISEEIGAFRKAEALPNIPREY
jgi:hypothetical protein